MSAVIIVITATLNAFTTWVKTSDRSTYKLFLQRNNIAHSHAHMHMLFVSFYVS